VWASVFPSSFPRATGFLRPGVFKLVMVPVFHHKSCPRPGFLLEPMGQLRLVPVPAVRRCSYRSQGSSFLIFVCESSSSSCCGVVSVLAGEARLCS
jgi:hypothetical protein